jgi:hypothetical protein
VTARTLQQEIRREVNIITKIIFVYMYMYIQYIFSLLIRNKPLQGEARLEICIHSWPVRYLRGI